MLCAGRMAGLAYGTAADDIGGKLPTVIGSAAVQLPAVWLVATVALALFGLATRFTLGGVGRAGRIHRGVPAGFVVRLPAVGA
jgi:hypothetical protein